MAKKIFYHASHEQFTPSALLRLVELAEQAGFNGALSSDHFHPWSPEQGHSGYAWSWLGAAMARTQKMNFNIVNAPGQRYHPAIIAQAAATLAEMFPDRFKISLGSGQALNEKITGTYWPGKQERNQRLKECVDIIRALWNGETVTHKGLVTVEEAKLYTRPKTSPLIAGAALTEETAKWVGSWADALITISYPEEQLQKMIDAFRSGGGEGKPLILKFHISYDESEEKALQGAYEEWKPVVFKSDVLTELRTPQQFKNAAEYVEPEVMKEHIKLFVHPDQYISQINKYFEMGFEEIVVHNVNVQQEKYIEFFGSKVIPGLDL
jgi:coenzyme F420-dependent glucose-6-phosphate dehydrogenase